MRTKGFPRIFLRLSWYLGVRSTFYHVPCYQMPLTIITVLRPTQALLRRRSKTPRRRPTRVRLAGVLFSNGSLCACHHVGSDGDFVMIRVEGDDSNRLSYLQSCDRSSPCASSISRRCHTVRLKGFTDPSLRCLSVHHLDDTVPDD